MASRALKRFGLMSLLCFGLAFCAVNAARGQSSEHLKKQMEHRLEGTKLIMAGLAIDDWSRISQGTKELLNNSQFPGWSGPLKEQLEKRDKALHMAAKTLSLFVEAKNGDGARLAYIQVVTLCMDCHNLGKE